MIGVMVPSVFADVVITSTIGSATPGCEVSSSCFFPSVGTVNVGETIIFLNTDSVPHTFTAGTPEIITGEFDTSVLMSGDSYVWTADSGGIIDYFCMLHPWMVGVMVIDSPVVISSPTNITFDSIPSTVPLDYGLIPITGQLTTSDGTPVSGKTIHLYGISNRNVETGGSTFTDSNGYFERSLQLWHEIDHPGNWEVFVYFEGDADYDSSVSASRYITVEPTVTTVPITISINKSTYEDGDFLLVSGTATPNEELEIILFANAENVVAREFITVDSSGSYSTSLETFDSTYMVFGEYGVLAASQTVDIYNVVCF